MRIEVAYKHAPENTSDFDLGYHLAFASDSELERNLAHRPSDLARLRRIKTLIERVLPIIDHHRRSPNEQALSHIVPIRTVRSQRHITAVRLRKMQAELSDNSESINALTTSEFKVGRFS